MEKADSASVDLQRHARLFPQAGRAAPQPAHASLCPQIGWAAKATSADGDEGGIEWGECVWEGLVTKMGGVGIGGGLAGRAPNLAILAQQLILAMLLLGFGGEGERVGGRG